MELETTVYSASEDDGQIYICAVMNISLSFLFGFEVILSINSTDESSLEGLHKYIIITQSCIILFYRFSCSTDTHIF